MRPEVRPPGRGCDGWIVRVCEELDPVYVVAGTGPDRESAIRAAVRETFVLLGVLARMLDAPEPAPPAAALVRLHQVAALYLAGACSREALAEACMAAEVDRAAQRG